MLAGGGAIRLIWQHRTTAWDRRQSWWPYGDRSWLTFVRFFPMALATSVICLVSFALIPFASPDGKLHTPVDWSYIAVGAYFIALIPLLLTMYFFDRPKFLMPPHLRQPYRRNTH